MKIRLMLTACALAACGPALAKLPAPVLDDVAKAKAAEAAARTAWAGKVDAFLTCKAQDRVAAAYKKTAATRPAPVTAAGAAPVAAAPVAAATAPAAPVAAVAPTPSNSGKPATTAEAGGTPVAMAAAPTIPPCADPGPFAYSPPEQKPLETSGAHSPASNATSPPSVKANSAQMAPAGPATAQSKKP